MHEFPPGRFPPPEPFVVESDVEKTAWIDDGLAPLPGLHERGVPVAHIVPRGFEAYARVFHPAKRFFGPSIEQSTPLRWSEIAAARGKTVHPEMQIEALIDNPDGFDSKHWETISTGGGRWFPPYDALEKPEALELVQVLRPFTAAPENAWFMLWDGYGDLGRGIDGIPRGMIHPDRSGKRQAPDLTGQVPALRHYLVFRGPLDALSAWFDWRTEGPNYWWPDDRAWIVATEIDGFSTYVGATRSGIDRLLASPLLEALPAALDHRFDSAGDTVNAESHFDP